MHGLHDLLALLRRLAGRARILSPGYAVSTVVLLGLSQVLLLISFILPLKVVLLVTRPQLPAYLSPWVPEEARVSFILLLALVAIISYGVHHLCKWGATRASQRGGERILASHEKLRVFADTESLVQDSYFRLGRLLASLLLATTAFTLGFWLDTQVFLILAALVVLESSVLLALSQSRSGIGLTVQRWLSTRLNVMAGTAGSLNFLIAFVVLLVGYLGTGGGNALIAIVTLLLARESQQRLVTMLLDSSFIAKRQERIRPLYFTTETAPIRSPKQDSAERNRQFWPEERRHWLGPCIQEVLGHDAQLSESYWIDSDHPGIVLLRASVDQAGQRGEIWIKYFPKNQSVRAYHEAALLSTHRARQCGLPGWFGRLELGDAQLLVLPFPGSRHPNRISWRHDRLNKLATLWTMKPDSTLLRRYRQTHRLLTDRMPASRLDELQPALQSARETEKLAQLKRCWPNLLERLGQQPLALHNPAMSVRGNWREDADGIATCLRWDQWLIEPVGCDAVLLEYSLDEVRSCFNKLEWGTNTPPEAEITLQVANLQALERALDRRQFEKAKTLAFRLLKTCRA